MNRDHRAERLNPTTLRSSGVLVLRVVVGVTFLLHGLDKLGDLAGTERFFVSLGIPAPALMAPLVAVTEAVGGVLLIAGLATPLVGAALATDMLVALLTAHLGQGFFVRDGGIELTLLLGGASLGIGLVGAGRFSLDASLDLPERFLRRVGAASRCAGGQLVGAPSAVADAPAGAKPEPTGPKTRDSDAALTRTRPSRADAKVTT